MGLLCVPVFVGNIFKSIVTEAGNPLQEASAAVSAEYIFIGLGIISVVIAVALFVSCKRRPELCLDAPAGK